MRLIIVMAQITTIFSLFSVLTITYLLLCKVRSELQIAPGTTYDELYTSAIDAYNEESWDDTIFYMEYAIKEFKFYRVKLAECRRACQGESRVTLPDNSTLNELKFFHAIFKKAACLRTCKSTKLGDRQLRISEEVTNKFLTLLPYSYLQFAYYKQQKYYEAQCAAYTYLKAHPTDDVMRNNLDYYYNVYGAENETIVNKEEKPHQQHFLNGNTAHEDGNFSGVIKEIELALKFYWWADEECRALCEGQYDSREFLDLYESIAGHYAHNLYCKEQCDDQLATIEGEVIADYLALHFHYLQYAYYKVNRISEAVDRAATFLLLKPSDPEMMGNMEYYESELGVSKYQVKIRPKVQAHADRHRLEKELLEFATTYFWEETEDGEEGAKGTYGSAEPIDPREVRLRDGVVISEDEDDDDEDDADPVYAAKKKRGDVGSVLEKGHDDDLVQDETGANDTGLSDDGENEVKLEGDIEKDELEITSDEKDLEDDYDYDDEEAEDFDTDYFEPERPHLEEERKRREEERQRLEAERNNTPTGGTVRESKYYEQFMVDSDLDKEEEMTRKMKRKKNVDEPRPPKGPGGRDFVQHDMSNLYQSIVSFDLMKEMASEESRVPYPSLAGITLHKDPVALKGKSRVAVDGMASQEECLTLVKLISEEATLGDGYKGRSQPFSTHEEFEGVTVKDAVEASAEDRMPLYYPATMIYLAERSRAFAQQFFSIPTHLFFSFTHLVCRHAKKDSPSDREDLSHPVHADNCIVDHKRHMCRKEDPAFTWRDYSAVLYLNDDFDGGNFMFANYDNSSQVEVQPKCGRLVAFSGENLHGVRPILKGQRCALAMWYTLDPSHQELDMVASWKEVGDLLERNQRIEAYKRSLATGEEKHLEL